MKREYKLIASITGAVIVCALVLMYLRRKESYTNSFSNGNSGPEIVELNAKIGAWYRPYGWTARRLLITSGLIRVVTVTTVHIHRTSGYQNKPLRHMVAEPVSDITGRKASASSLVLEKGWPSNDQYTFFHVTRYDGPSRNRIWTNVNGAKARGVNWLSGHWEGGATSSTITNGFRPATKSHRSVSVADIYRQTRSNQIVLAGESVMEGRKSSKFRALFHGAGIGTKTRYSREQSDGACGSYPIRS
jgi:hypothetical protein